jgi:hypothetical protein
LTPRQLLRLREIRRSDAFDDQKTPTEILQAEIASVTDQDLLQYLLSQVRQILGTVDWKDPVPASLTTLAGTGHRNTFACACTAAETVGKFVYIAGPAVGGVYEVRNADPYDGAKMPIFGTVISKASATACTVQWTGEVTGVFSGMTPGKVYFVGTAGAIVLTPLVGNVYVQKVGIALAESVLLLIPDLNMTRRVA